MFLKSIFRHPAHYSLVAGFLAFTSLFFLSCFETKTSPLDPNTVSELQYKGSISGHVRDEATTKGISGVSVVCAPGGFSTSTDTTGHYIIPDVSGGTYSVTFSGNKYNDSILNGITIAIDQDLPELDVFLKKFLCKFGGTITDNRTAAKLAGTTITAVSTDNVSFTTTTDTAGNYVLNLIIGTYTVTFMRDGYLPVTVAGIDVKKGQYSYPFSQQLKSAICQISGNVLDKRTLSGIAGVQVSIDSTTITATTNVDGYYIINVPNDSARSLSVNFTHAIYRDTTVKGISVAKEQALRSLNIMLVEEIGSISGKVTDQQTLAGITGVAVTCNISGITTTTDQTGNYTLTNLLPGMYKLTFTNTQYRTTRMDSVFISSGEQKTGINIALGKLSSSIAGRVIDIQGNSISGVAVTIGSLGFSTTTSTDGTYVLPNVPQGTYTLFFTNADYRDTSVANVNLTSGQFLTGVDVSMRILLSSIAGKVTDKTTGGGISGVAVTTSKVGITTTTDQSGNYVLSNLSKGSYRLTFTNAQYHDTTLADSVKVVAGENKAGVNVAMDKLQSSVSGSVIDQESAAGISGVTVTASPGGYSSSTNSSGTFTIPNVPQGTYALSFTNSNYKDTILLGVTLSAGEYKTGINITMLKLRATISGVVTNLAKGTPEQNVTVTTNPFGYSSTTDNNGAYLLSGILADTFTLRFSKTGFIDTTSTNIMVMPGQNLSSQNIKIRQLAIERSISGSLSGNISTISRVTATVTGDTIAVTRPLIDTLDWIAGVFSGKIHNPVVGTNWTVEIRVFDNLGHLVAYRKQPFGVLSGAIGIPPFNAENAKPAAKAGNDTTVSINDTIVLHASAVDSFYLSGSNSNPASRTNISKWEWSIDGGPFYSTNKSDSIIFAPASPRSTFKCVLRVTDSDGNIGLDTLNDSIILAPPVVSAGNDTAVSLGASFTIAGTATRRFGRIISYQWRCANQVLSGNSATFSAPIYPGEMLCTLSVTDDDGFTVTGTRSIWCGNQWTAWANSGNLPGWTSFRQAVAKGNSEILFYGSSSDTNAPAIYSIVNGQISPFVNAREVLIGDTTFRFGSISAIAWSEQRQALHVASYGLINIPGPTVATTECITSKANGSWTIEGPRPLDWHHFMFGTTVSALNIDGNGFPLACSKPTGPIYSTIYRYDGSQWLQLGTLIRDTFLFGTKIIESSESLFLLSSTKKVYELVQSNWQEVSKTTSDAQSFFTDSGSIFFQRPGTYIIDAGQYSGSGTKITQYKNGILTDLTSPSKLSRYNPNRYQILKVGSGFQLLSAVEPITILTGTYYWRFFGPVISASSTATASLFMFGNVPYILIADHASADDVKVYKCQ